MIRAVSHVASMASYPLADTGSVKSVSMAQNESAFPPSPVAIEAGRAAMADAALYADPGWRDLRAAIAMVHGLKPDQICCGSGSMELISALIRAFTGPGDTVLSTQYGYAYTATACDQAQSEYRMAPEQRYCVSVEQIAQSVTPQTRIVYISNPGNPTGTLISNAKLLQLRRVLADDVLLVVDQAYGEFADAAQSRAEIFALVEQGNTAVIRTFSKAYGLAGARVGWGYFPPQIAAELRKLLNPGGVSAISQAMARAAMDDQAHMSQVVAQTSGIREDFSRNLRELGIEVPPSYTNFVLLRFPGEDACQAADKALRAENLVMRGMGGYGLPECLRATICAPEIMDKAMAVLRRVAG